MSATDPRGNRLWSDADLARNYATVRGGLSPAMHAQWGAAFRAAVPDATIRRVLDVGCGTARFTALLADAFGARAIGIDRSPTMLRERLPRPDLTFAAAAVEAMPFADASIDVALMSLMIHFLPDLPAALRDVARIVRPGGFVLVRTPTRDLVERHCFLPYFPEALAIDRARMPAADDLVAAFAAAGFVNTVHDTVVQEFAPTAAAACVKVRARAFSVLLMISDEAFARGLPAFERACDTAPPGPVEDAVAFLVFRRATRGSG